MNSNDADPDLAGSPRHLGLELSFRGGWCWLMLINDEGSTITIKASSLFDSFANFVIAVSALDERSTPCQTVIWGGENNGWFIDLSANDFGGLGFVVHEMDSVRWLSDRDAWRPVRGRAVFQDHLARPRFLATFANEAARIRAGPTEVDGSIKGWGRPFPEAAYQQLLGLL